MRLIFGLVLILGMGLAGFAVYTAQGYFSDQEALIAAEREKLATAVETVDVYAPVRAMTYGEQITKDDVILIKYAVDYLPEGVFLTEEELFPQGVNILRVVKRPMEINEPIMAVKVTEPGASRGLTALLDRGMRAFPLQDSVTRPLQGSIRPTTRLDVLFSGRLIDGSNKTRLVRSNLEVIAVDEPDENGRGGGGGVVLQVTPEDFAALTQAQNNGQLSIGLRGAGDDGVIEAIEIDTETALGVIIEEEVVAEPEVVIEDKVCTIQQGFGANAVDVVIDCIE